MNVCIGMSLHMVILTQFDENPKCKKGKEIQFY